MGQLEDFRASLKRKDSAVSSEGEIPVKSIAKAKQEKMKRRTLGVSGELHLELKALSVWRIKSHPKASSVSEGSPIRSGMTAEVETRLRFLPRLHFKVFLHCHLHCHHRIASTFISSHNHKFQRVLHNKSHVNPRTDMAN